MQRLILTATAAAILGAGAPGANAAPHERSCDGKPATFHVHRAKVLISKAYDLERWPDATPAKDWEVRAFQDHKTCVRDAKLREEIEDRRAELAAEFSDYRAYRLVTPYAGGGAYWAIPFYIVACESYGGSWSASNGSHVGPYQLAWNWGPPWPVDSFADQLAHHRIAARLWAGGAGASHWACA